MSDYHYYFAQVTADGVDLTWRGGGTRHVKTLGDLKLPMKEARLKTDF